MLFTLAGLLQCIRIPGYTMIVAAGHYRQTQSRAVLEAIINLGISAVLIRPFGISGVMIGLCTSHLYRTTDMILYSRKKILHGSIKTTVKRLVRNGFLFVILSAVGIQWVPQQAGNWPELFGCAVIVGFIGFFLFGSINFAAEKKQRKQVLERVFSIFNSR